LRNAPSASLRSLLAICLFLLLYSLPATRLNASPPPPDTLPLEQRIAKADIVAVAQMTSYAPATATTDNDFRPADMPLSMTRVQPPGRYQFRKIQTIKGTLNSQFVLGLPGIFGYYYDGVRVPTRLNDYVLLMLSVDKSGELRPVDPTRPFDVLGHPETAVPVLRTEFGVNDLVLQALAFSFRDPQLRQANVVELRETLGLPVMKALLPYIDDGNLRTRNSILCCYAANRQLAAIPRIAELAESVWKTGDGPACLMRLSNFKTAEARPLLNPLLFAKSDWTRVNAMTALTPLADRGSVPYMLLALRDPEPQHIVNRYSEALIRSLVRGVGVIAQESIGARMTRSDLKKLLDCRRTDLETPLLHVPDAPAQPLPPDAAVADVDEALFSRSLPVRREAAARLKGAGSDVSVPYLLVGLLDSDAEVSYDAYAGLCRLIPALGAPLSRADFDANRVALTLPAFDWWTDELLGKHAPARNRLPKVAP
jgi:hypothetical protein